MTEIVHVISGLGTGGAETMLTQLAGALRLRGFSQQVVSLSGHGTKSGEIEAAGVPVVTLDLRTVLSAPLDAMKLTRLIWQARPNVIQGWMYHGDLFAALAHHFAPGRASRKLFWNIRASDMDLERYRGLLRLNAFLSGRPDMILANSRAGLDCHIARGYRPRRSDVIPNGVDVDKFRPDPDNRLKIRSGLGLREDAVVAIHVARVDPMKDHQTFLAAMATIPQVQGLMVGMDTDKLDAPSNVRALGIRTDVDRLYSAADVVVSSSAYGEGFSNVLAEGMSTGLVPMTTDTGDAQLIVGDTGAFFPVRSPQSLAKELAAFAGLPAPERRERGLAARRRVEERFTLTKTVDRFAALYAECRS
jgi:glycosyltransferase involved in cell wall biosynthesis